MWFYFLFFTSVSGLSLLPIDPTNCTSCSPFLCPNGTNETCEFGSIQNPNCECCKICLKEAGNSCGLFFGIENDCADGLQCETIVSVNTYPESKICVIPRNESINATDCGTCTEYYKCKTETCELGSVPHPYCNCCTVCLKGEGEICEGHPYLPETCAVGFRCEKKDIISSQKTCVNESLPENSCAQCHPFDCPSMQFCAHGMIENPRCECCPICKRGRGESCGGFTALPNVCAEGLLCVGEHLAVDVPGTCQCDKTKRPPALQCLPRGPIRPRGPKRPRFPGFRGPFNHFRG